MQNANPSPCCCLVQAAVHGLGAGGSGAAGTPTSARSVYFSLPGTPDAGAGGGGGLAQQQTGESGQQNKAARMPGCRGRWHGGPALAGWHVQG